MVPCNPRGELILGFDALGRHLEAEGIGQGDDGGHQGGVVVRRSIYLFYQTWIERHPVYGDTLYRPRPSRVTDSSLRVIRSCPLS